ncbi:hypothetical protein [Chromobacterium violaceum]|uniref:hypothetical protein n=1 Tax=Chromobacterium violaceum TaxID=536 RepID=UPI0012D46F87|nr:hypothetical protein [Chromobacterium violaceum]
MKNMDPIQKNTPSKKPILRKSLKSIDLKNLLLEKAADVKTQEEEKLKAEKEKIESENKKTKEDKRKAIAEWLLAHSKLLIGFTTAYGFVLLLLYCISQANFFPSGLSIGDSVLLLFIALAFGFITFLIAGMGLLTFHPWISYTTQVEKPQKNPTEEKAKIEEKSNVEKIAIQDEKKKTPTITQLIAYIFSTPCRIWLICERAYNECRTLTVGLACELVKGFFCRIWSFIKRIAGAINKTPETLIKVIHAFFDIRTLVITTPFLLTFITLFTIYVAENEIFPSVTNFFNNEPYTYIKTWSLLLGPIPLIAIWTYILTSKFKKQNLKADYLTWFFVYLSWYFTGMILVTSKVPWTFIGHMLSSGFILSLLVFQVIDLNKSIKQGKKDQTNIKIGIAIFSTILLAMPLFQWADIGSKILNNGVIQPLGIFQERAALWVSKTNLETLEDAAKLQDIPLSVCKNPDGSAVVTDLRVWWHGIGNRSYVQLLGFSDQDEKKIEREKKNNLLRNEKPYYTYPRVELKADEARLIFSKNVRCTEINDALVFPSDKNQPEDSYSAKKMLAEQIKPFLEIKSTKDNKNLLVKIAAIGYADPMPRPNASNEALGRERATHALLMLCDKNLYKGIDNPNIEIKSMGARSLVKDCTSIKDVNLSKECNAANRRVDLRFSYSLEKPNSANTLDDFCKKNKL